MSAWRRAQEKRTRMLFPVRMHRTRVLAGSQKVFSEKDVGNPASRWLTGLWESIGEIARDRPTQFTNDTPRGQFDEITYEY